MSLNCESIQRNFSLFLYGELKMDEEERIQTHLESCGDCQAALEKMSGIHNLLDCADVPVPDGLLVTARRGLRERIANDKEAAVEGGWLSAFSSWLGGGGAVWKPVGAVAMIALAFAGGRFSTRDRVAAILPEQPAPAATSIRFVEPDPSGNGIRIALDETRQRTVRGSLEDPAIRQLLLSAARTSADPGLRAESVEVLGKGSEEVEIRDALLHTLENDGNAAVRMKALEGLKQFSRDQNARAVLKRVLLQDSNSNVRAMAIDVLTQTPSHDMVAPLQELMRKEENDYVRMRTQTVLSQMKASPGVF